MSVCRSALWSWAPLALAVSVMVPRLASPEFGLLDDGFTLQTGRELVGRWWHALFLIPDTGRFSPAHWLTWAALFGAAGARPLAFFAVNTLLLAALLAMLMRLVQLGGGTRRDAAIAALLFALSGPAVEAFYTLSKAEPLQLSFIGLSLLLTAAAVAQRTRARRAGLAALATGALLLALATKETGVAVVPISIGWLLIERWWIGDRAAGLAFARTYAGLAVAAALAFGALRWHFAPLGLGEGWYTRAYSVDLRTLGAAAFRMSAWLVRDFAILLPVAAVAIASLAGRPRRPPRRLVPYASVWMAGWLAVYLPWPVTFEYYLLPFALGAAALGGIVIGDVLARLRQMRVSRAGAMGTVGVLAATALLWAAALVNAAGDARVQLAVDRANADLVDFLATLPTRSRVAVNTPWLNEYVVELRLHLTELKQRSDIAVEHLPPAGAGPRAGVFIATPALVDPPVPTVRIPLDEPGVRHVNARLDTLLDGRGELVYRAEQRAGVLELGLHRVLCGIAPSPLVGAAYCPPDRPLIRARTFSYGWQVHRVHGRAG